MNFEDAIQHYKQARGQYERGEIPGERLEEIVNSLQLTDANGQIWQIGVKTGKWYRFDGQNWVEDLPQEFERSSGAVPMKATFVPPPPPVEPRDLPVSRPQNGPKKNIWLSGFLIVAILGLCCVIAGVGGWLLWSSDLLSFTPPTNPLSVPPATAEGPSPAQPEPTTLAEPGHAPDLIQFQDDFSDPGSGWDDVRVNEEANTYYFESEYMFLINQADIYAWANPYKNFTGDVQVEVDARKISGSVYDEFGLLCRYAENSDDTASYYYFAIAVDGLGVIYKIDHDEKSLIITDPPNNRSDVIHPVDQVNRVRADCIGDTLSLYVNGEFLIDAVDSSLGSGDVGLRADSETGDTELRFDNFVVYKPGE